MRSVRERLSRRMGVRVRSAVAAGIVVAVASALAGVVLLVTAREILQDNATTVAIDRAAQLAAAITTGSPEALTSAVSPSAPDRTLVQVIDASGTVTAASAEIEGQAPISDLRPAGDQRAQETRQVADLQEPASLIIAQGVATPRGVSTVLVAESLDLVDDGTEAIIAALLVGMPLLAIVVAVATFLFVGRTLRPVEAMRSQAATITARNLHTRLPVPAADDEIAALAATMNTMLDRIEAASAAQRRFVADASHELRSPLATIHANADLLAAVGLDPDPRRYVDRIRIEGGRMTRLVDDLLLLARLDDAPPRRDDVDLDDLVYGARERVTTEHPGLTVTSSIQPVRVQGDPDQLHRALRNLVDNAVRHARSEVTLRVSARIEEAEIMIGNDGPPINPADRDRIFDRFIRLDDSRSREAGGTGLGLAIARDIVVAHGGTLTVAEVPAGAAMRIRLSMVGSFDLDPPDEHVESVSRQRLV